jgi:hypothetical protein
MTANESDDENESEQRSPRSTSSESPESRPESGARRKRTIPVPANKFDLLHTILYYTYTGRITFGTDLGYKQPDATLPKICDAQDIYEVAHDLALEQVKSKALTFLKATCTPKNITARLLSPVTADRDHRFLTEFYSDYFTKHWHKIRDTDEHNEFMGQAEDGDDFVDIMRSFRDLMKKVELKV